MPYKIRLTHIHSDYSVEPTPTKSWSVRIEEDEELVLMMNRVAITSSQHPVVDFPTMEITLGSTRVVVTAVSGQLYYTDPNSPNRQNLKVIAEEAIQLLHGNPLEIVFQPEAEAETSKPVRYRPSGMGPWPKAVLLLSMAVIVGFCVKVIKDHLGYRPSLVASIRFIPSIGGGEVFREVHGIYVDQYREGGLVLEVTKEGHFNLYEMWHSKERGGFILLLIESHEVLVGSQDGQQALLAGEVFLLLPQHGEKLFLNGIMFRRYLGTLKDIGEVLSK